MNCKQARLILAVSSREWSAAERTQVEAHLEACPSCAALAREYALQEKEIATLPRPTLSPAQREAVRAQARREAAWLCWRMRLSNALGTAAAALLVLFLALALSALLRHPPAPAAMLTATPSPTARPATSPSPTAVLQPTVIPGTTSAVPLILVDNSPRSGLGPTEPFPHPNLYALLGGGHYQVRYRLAGGGIQPEPDQGIESPPITAEELADVTLLIIPWTSCYAAGGGTDGFTVYDFNLTPAEAQAIREFVASGGQALLVLDPTYRCHFEALSLLGIQAKAEQAITWNDEEFHQGAGRLGEQDYALAAQYRFQPLAAPDGEPWARLDGRDALVMQRIGRGRVAVLGLPSLVNGMRFVSPEADQGQPAPLFAADNLAFLVAVVEELTGAPSGLEVEAIVWEERMGALQQAAEHLVERLDAWTEQRIAWAAPRDETRQALAGEVVALRTHLAEAVEQVDGLMGNPDPARYQAVRGLLAEVLDGTNRLDRVYGPLANESWEARQTRRLQPWLLGLLAGGALLGLAAWRVRRLDATPSALVPQGIGLLPYAIAVLLLLVHLLAAADMVGFGLRTGGYPLNRWGVWLYAALAGLWALLFFLPRASGLLRLALPLLAALTLLQVHLLTDLAGAEYATYRDYEQELALMYNLSVALASCLAGVLYRRPRWLAAMAGIHLAMALGVMGGDSLFYALRDGFEPWQLYQPCLPPSPLPYLAILYGLGLLAAHPVQPRTYWSVLAGLLGLFVAGGTLLFSHGYTWMDSSAPTLFDWLTNLLLVPLLLAVGILSAAYRWSARRAAQGRLSLASPLTATVLLLGLAALLTSFFLAPSFLPESGAAMPWQSATYRVPDRAWTLLLPIARVLAAFAPWLVLLSVTLQSWRLLSRPVPPPPPPPQTRRRLWGLSLVYSGLLLTAVVAALALLIGRGLSPAMVWDSRRGMVLAGILSPATVVGLTAWLTRRSGPGRWGSMVYSLALAVQIPVWLLGLGRLIPFDGLNLLLSMLQGIPLSSVGDLIVPGLTCLALAALVWHLIVAARAVLSTRGD